MPQLYCGSKLPELCKETVWQWM